MLDQAIDLDGGDMAGRRRGPRQGETDIDQRRAPQGCGKVAAHAGANSNRASTGDRRSGSAPAAVAPTPAMCAAERVQRAWVPGLVGALRAATALARPHRQVPVFVPTVVPLVSANEADEPGRHH